MRIVIETGGSDGAETLWRIIIPALAGILGALIGAGAAIWGGSADRKAAATARQEEREGNRAEDHADRQRRIAEQLARELGLVADAEAELAGASGNLRFAHARGWQTGELSAKFAAAAETYGAADRNAFITNQLLEDDELRAMVKAALEATHAEAMTSLRSVSLHRTGAGDPAADAAASPRDLMPSSAIEDTTRFGEVITLLGEAVRRRKI